MKAVQPASLFHATLWITDGQGRRRRRGRPRTRRTSSTALIPTVAGQPLVPYLVVLHLVPDRHRCRSTWRRRREPGPALLGGGAGPAAIKKSYVETAQNASANNSIVTLLEALGLLVVGIALIGLVGTLTLALIERTREVGILRCLGASARQIRRVFNTEAVVMATAGWALGSLLGYVLFLGLIAFVEDEFGFTVARVFPVASLPVALVAVVFVTLIVVRPTLRRAVRLDPGRALRYE